VGTYKRPMPDSLPPSDREIAAKLRADLERAEQLRGKAVAVMVEPERSFSGLSDYVTTGYTSGDGLDAVRWAGDGTAWVADPLPSWRDVPILSGPLETEIIALPWECLYCGSTNPGEALYCGQCGPSHCGAPNPRCNEPPRGVLHLRGSRPAPLVISGEMPEPSIHFYPEPDMEVTIYHPGRLAGDFELELAARLRSAFQRAIRGAMSLC